MMQTVPLSPSTPRALFTAPWEPLVVRRGDALGLRALTDELADAVTPGLSNRTNDGRWLTILAWALVRSHQAFRVAGGRSMDTRAERAARYAWLRPLEMMWVARTIALAPDWSKRVLPGQRRVAPWVQLPATKRTSSSAFGMSPEQLSNYRQTGPYGGYRMGFRRWPGLTVDGDGWTPGPMAIRLADWLDGQLKASAPPSLDDDEQALHLSIRKSKGDPGGWWLRNWTTFLDSMPRGEALLPRPRDEFTALPEHKTLAAVLFDKSHDGQRRRDVVTALAGSSAEDHIGVCDELAAAFPKDHRVATLPAFSRLADAGMATMEAIADELVEPTMPIAKIAASSAVKEQCAALRAAAREWRKAGSLEMRHADSAHQLATAVDVTGPTGIVTGLVHHHQQAGGGLRWFRARGSAVERVTMASRGSSYRFRLWSLARLATQTRLLDDMVAGLSNDGFEVDEADGDDFEGSGDDE